MNLAQSVTSETIWQALNLAVLSAATAAARRKLRKWSRNSSEAAASEGFRAAAKAETKETTRSAEARRLWKWKRGIRALEKAKKKCDGEGDLDRRRVSSFSFRL